MLRPLLLIFLLLVTPAFAKAGELPPCRDSGARASCAKEWTVLIYMAATADLLPYALADLNEMEAPFAKGGRAATTPKLDLLVQIERPEAPLERRRIFAR